MSLVDKLLQMDAATLSQLPEKEVEIKSLSEKLGERVLFKCRAIDGKRYAEIKRQAFDFSKKGAIKDIDTHKVSVLTVLAGVVDPDFKSKELMQHFNAVSPKDLLEKMVLAGEIDELKMVVEELSGYDIDEEEEREGDSEIKNLLEPIELPKPSISSFDTKAGNRRNSTGSQQESNES